VKTVQNETNGMPNKLHKPRTLHLFAGAGGGILGDILLGHHPVCAVEIDSYCQQVISARQADGCLPWFPIFEDVSKFDGNPWRGLVDIVAGGFPCQDISASGKGAGIEGERSGMWFHMARIIGEVRPRYAFVENSPMLTSRGLGRVLGDLAEMGYDARWGVLGASEVGAEHERERIWIAADSNKTQLKRGGASFGIQSKYPNLSHPRWGKDKSGVDRMANGMANQMDRLAAIGNGQVPAVAALAWNILSENPLTAPRK
jgi:DNA (cytosine-5)-methyltransferase 1